MAANNNNNQTEAVQSSSDPGSSAYRVAIKQTAQSLGGKDRYEFLLNNKNKELMAMYKLKSDTEAEYYTLPATRSQTKSREKLEKELDAIDEAIAQAEKQIQTLQQRVQCYEQIGQPWPTSAKPAASTISQAQPGSPAVQFSTPAGQMSTPAPRRLFTDPFSITSEASPELNPKQFIVPANLPSFRHGDNAIQDVDVFIRQFELTLNAHGLNHNKVWPRLLPLCIPFDMQDWLHRTHSPAHTWTQVSTSLQQQFGNPTKRRAAVVKIYTSKQASDESIIEFMQRFMKLIRQAQAEPDNQDMVDYFLEQLPTDLAIQLESAVQYGKIRRSVVDMEAFARSFPGVHTKKRTANFDKARSNKSAPEKPFYCATHGHCRHTTAQCKNPKKTASSQSTPKTAARASSSGATRSTSTLTVSATTATCYRCKETGHYANKCPTLESTVKSRRTWLREYDRNLSHNDLAEFEIPIQINGHHTSALVDTGANKSFIKQALADQLGLHVNHIEGIIELAIPGFSTPRIGHTDTIQLICGDESLETQLEVIKDLNGPPVFLGTDILPRLNIHANGLPFRFSDAVIPEEEQTDSLLPAIEPTSDSPPSDEPTEEQRTMAMHAIQPELDENSSISPYTPCPLDMAVVRLDTPEGRFTHKRQFPIAEKIIPAMHEVIEEWLKEGVITRVTEPTQFNTPIFPIPKKDPTGAKTLCRPCMDFRALNDLISCDKYPLPLISDIFDALKGSKYFTSLDLKSAYHRFPVLAEHQHKTAFTWNDVQYKFLRAPFGLKNLPSQFQRVIHFVF